MEAILFYGDQDEATRRQVRSVAAQYSHRIGPRKRKKSKLPKQTGQESKRGHYKKLATTTSDTGASSSKSHQDHPFQTVVSSQQYASHGQAQAQAESDVGGSLDAQQRMQRDLQIRRELSGSETCASSSEVGSDPTLSPHTPQFDLVRSTGASQSPDKPPSAYRRLPAYTWTEYPRYVGNQSPASPPKFTPTSAIAAKRRTLELPDPAGLSLQQNAPRSHPMDTPPRLAHSHSEGASSGHMSSRNSQRISDGHAMSKEETAWGQISSPPRLQVLRCATEANDEPGAGAARWRSGTVGGFSQSCPPG